MNSCSHCSEGLRNCFCLEGKDALGNACAQCNALSVVFCNDCQAGQELSELSLMLFEKKKGGIIPSGQSIQANLAAFRELSLQWNTHLQDHFNFIQKVCVSLLLDPHFIKLGIKSNWEFVGESWPIVSFNDPKPFARQLEDWLNRFIQGLNPILPQHYELKIIFGQMLILAQSCPFWNAQGSRDLQKHLAFSMRVRLLNLRIKEFGFIEETLKSPWIPVNSHEKERFIKML